MNTSGRRLLAGLSVIGVFSITVYFLSRSAASPVDGHPPAGHPADKQMDSSVLALSPAETTSSLRAATPKTPISAPDAHTLFRKSYYCYYGLTKIISAKSRADCS